MQPSERDRALVEKLLPCSCNEAWKELGRDHHEDCPGRFRVTTLAALATARQEGAREMLDQIYTVRVDGKLMSREWTDAIEALPLSGGDHG
jgi:hypothetical protein